jgi:hypothetical protein
MIDYAALIGTVIVVLIALAIRSAYRRYQAARQQAYDRAYTTGLAVGEARQGRLDYARGYTEGMAKAYERMGGEQQTSYEKGYERGQLDLLDSFEQADQLRGAGPAMSA